MEEKKRKKAKKKNRSAQLDNVAEVAAPLISQEQDSAFLDLQGVPSPAAVEAAAEEAPPALKQEEEEVQPEGSGSAEPYGMREELEQVVQELRSAFESETATTFRGFLEDFKASHTIAQASLEQLIEQLRKEVIQFNQWTGLQRNKEVVLDGNIQRLMEEVSQLRAMQEVQEEREIAKHAEIRQLREEIAKLNEGNARQLRKVEEMSDTIQLLLLERRQSATLNLAVCPSFANEGGVAWSPETSEQLLRMTPSQEMVAEAGATAGDSHLPVAAAATMAEGFIGKTLALVEKQRVSIGHAIPLQNNTVTNSSEPENIACSVSFVDHLVVEKNTEAPTRELSMIDSLRSEENEIETGSMDGHGPSLDNGAFVKAIADFKHTTQEKKEHYHESIPNMICSDWPQQALMQADHDLKPLSDAPITGAPIRLFRFVARYVSGADLVKG